jgi:hypothetical protein
LAEQTQEEYLDRQEFCETRGFWRQSSVSLQNLRTDFLFCWTKCGSFRANFAKLWQNNSVRPVTNRDGLRSVPERTTMNSTTRMPLGRSTSCEDGPAGSLGSSTLAGTTWGTITER